MDDIKALLKERLKEKMAEAGISANSLEKQAGLKRSAVQNILHGRSKKPSAEILHAIARVFNCSVDDFLTSTAANARINEMAMIDLRHGDEPINIQLYAKAAQLASELFIGNGVVLTKQQALNYIDEIYHYSLNNDNKDIDKNFAKWLMEKLLLNQANQ